MAAAPGPPPTHYVLTMSPPTLMPAGKVLCAKLGILPTEPCNSEAMLEAAQTQTDRSLWVSKTTGGDGPPPEDCLRATAVESYGDGKSPNYVCFEPEADDTVTPLDIERLETVARRLNADHPKTLAKHRWIMDFKELWKRVDP